MTIQEIKSAVDANMVETQVAPAAEDLMPRRMDAKPSQDAPKAEEPKSDEFITRDERMDLINLCESFGVSKDRFLAYLGDTYSIQTTAEIRRSAFELIRAWIRNGGETV